MPKRFTDTGKWKKAWFRKLPPKYKCFWNYILDQCDHAGIWEKDFELASFFIGEVINEAEVTSIFEAHVVLINGTKWLISDFIEFQYNCTPEHLNPQNKAHLSVIHLLQKQGASKGLADPSQGVKDKDKDKEQDKEKDNYKEEKFYIFWDIYGRKLEKVKTKKMFMKLSKTDIVDLLKFAPLYVQATPDKQFRKYPSTFLRNRTWDDDISAYKNNKTEQVSGITRVKQLQKEEEDEEIRNQQNAGVFKQELSGEGEVPF